MSEAVPIFRVKVRNLSKAAADGRESYVDVLAADDVTAMTVVRDRLSADGSRIEIIEAVKQ